MTIVVNDETRELPPSTTVLDLIAALGLEKRAYAVEVNKRLVPRTEHAQRRLAEGDRVEVVTLVGGG